MKKFTFSLIGIALSLSVFCQAPNSFSYQAVVRNSDGTMKADESVSIQIELLKGSIDGSSVYAETHTQNTNTHGLVTLEIGAGTTSDDIATIDWGDGLYFLKVSVDGTNLGATQLLSVPYALHAKTADITSGDSIWKKAGNDLYYNSGNVGLGTVLPSALFDLNIANDFSMPGFNIRMPDYNHQTSSNLAFAISSGWAVEGLSRSNIFKLYDEESSAVMELYKLGYNYVTGLSPGSLYMSGEGGNNIDLNWEEGFSYGSVNSGFNLALNSEYPLYFRNYAGGWNDRVKIDKLGNAYFAGDLMVDGAITGSVNIDTVHVSQISGLLGENYTMVFPQILDNTAAIEIEGILQTDVVIVSGPGHETERISEYIDENNGVIRFRENPGLTQEYPFIFETTNETDMLLIKEWFDHPTPDRKAASIIIQDLAGTETGRWILLYYLPDGYEPGNDGRTRFTMKHDGLPDNNNECVYQNDFGPYHSYNPTTDLIVEIEGVDCGGGGLGFSPAVELNTEERTITLTMDYNEGYRIYEWLKSTIPGNGTRRAVSIIHTTDGTSGTETHRYNHFECIPIIYEHVYGFGLNVKLKARIVIAYGFREEA